MKLLLILSLLLCFLMALVGGNRGVQSFLALIGNVVVICGYLFLVTKGLPPVVGGILAIILFSMLTLCYQNGRNEKTFLALLSVGATQIGVGLLTWGTVAVMKIAGMNELDLFEEDSMYLSEQIGISMDQVMIAVILIGLLGAIMDTSMSIASGSYEIWKQNPNISRQELTKSGMRIGGQILGTTVNTLFFVALGEMIMLTLLIQQAGYSLSWLLNAKVIAQEALPIMISCLGCLIVIPATAVGAAEVYLAPRELIRKLLKKFLTEE